MSLVSVTRLHVGVYIHYPYTHVQTHAHTHTRMAEKEKQEHFARTWAALAAIVRKDPAFNMSDERPVVTVVDGRWYASLGEIKKEPCGVSDSHIESRCYACGLRFCSRCCESVLEAHRSVLSGCWVWQCATACDMARVEPLAMLEKKKKDKVVRRTRGSAEARRLGLASKRRKRKVSHTAA